jgi:DNA-binding transcriptional LysR family regulator
MASARRNIKSLSALFAFEAAGRTGNFTTAARELGVTQAAVSKQIAQLEEDVGTPLFTRGYREVHLTPKGRELFEVATVSLSSLGDALSRLRSSDPARPISIGATVTMSHFWLLPRLPSFKAVYADVQVRVVSQDEPMSVADGDLDMVIRFGNGKWEDGRTLPFFKSLIYPMASPGFLKSRPQIRTIGDIAACPIIEYDAPDSSWASWSDWFTAAGSPPPRLRASLSFSKYLDAIQAAIADQGVILVWGGLTGGVEERGGLVRLPGPGLKPRGDFHLVVGSRGGSVPGTQAVVDWLLREANEHQSALALYPPIVSG